MALKIQKVMGTVLVLMVMVWGGARAQTSSCTNTLMGLTPCLNYVTGNSSTPSSGCCLQLATIVQTQPRCLCSLLNSNNIPNLGVTINQTLALSLPGACNVQTPPISLCNGGVNGPAGAPASAPTSQAIAPSGSNGPDSEETPVTQAPTASSVPSTPSGSRSKATPSTNTNTSNGSMFGAPTYLMLVILFIGMKL